jgi:hypothetical protein
VLCLRKLPPPIDFATERKGSSGPGDLVFQDTRACQMATRPVLVVTVDDRAAVTVDQKNGGSVEGLALGVTHVVRASRPGVSRQAARFSFVTDGESGNVLELHYDPFYGNIHVEPPRPARPATTGNDRRAVLRRLCRAASPEIPKRSIRAP